MFHTPHFDAHHVEELLEAPTLQFATSTEDRNSHHRWSSTTYTAGLRRDVDADSAQPVKIRANRRVALHDAVSKTRKLPLGYVRFDSGHVHAL